MREQEIDALWRQRTGNGIRTDSATVEQELAVLDQARARLAEAAGVDLARNSHATRAWVLDRGITIVDQAGKPTHAHRSFAEAKVPPGAEADWALFLRAREISRTENKVRELSQSVISGRVWPEIHTIGAVTGRMSISDPALQNLPADVRRVLMADEGNVLVGCDLDRVEPRTLAALSGDGALVEAVKGDVYMVLAREIWGAAAGTGHRAAAKTALLATIYGQGTASLARRLKVEPREAANIRAGMRRAWPTAMRWLDGRQAAAERGERQYSWAGRPLPISHEAPYRAANHAIQSSAADLFKLLTLQVAANLPTGATVFLPIHDELIVECPKGLADEVVVVLGEQMRAEINGVEIAGAPVVLGGRLQHA
jgi:DNA polymerase I-like protein with 3'-5' exonuclease and polymerase domains